VKNDNELSICEPVTANPRVPIQGHEVWGKHNGTKVRQAYLRQRLQHFGSWKKTTDQLPCPLKGRRAPEFANGSFITFIEDINQVSEKHLKEHVVDLAPADRAKLVQDWVIATESRQQNQRIKISPQASQYNTQ